MDDVEILPAVVHGGSPATWEDLPAALVTNILSRLPVKTLIRSTSVNKSWYASIKNPSFISEHINRSISSNASKTGDSFILAIPASLAQTTSSNPCSLISEKSGAEVSNFEIPFSTKHGTVKIVGSCNGLVCLTEEIPGNYGMNVYLWNPSGRKFKRVVNSCYNNLLRDTSTLRVAIGFGYHQDGNDYRIVRIIYSVDCYRSVYARVEVYSLRSNSWRKIVKAEVPTVVDCSSQMYVDDAIYWLKDSGSNKAPPPYESVVSFDLRNEVFQEVRLPRNVRRGFRDDYHQTLMNFKGSVGVFVCGLPIKNLSGVVCSLWVLREDGTWTRKKRFALPLWSVGFPVKFTKSGDLILEGPILCDDPVKGLIISINIDNLEVQKFMEGGPYTVVPDFTESLVLLEEGHFIDHI